MESTLVLNSLAFVISETPATQSIATKRSEPRRMRFLVRFCVRGQEMEVRTEDKFVNPGSWRLALVGGVEKAEGGFDDKR